jgi:hypothetical protein
MDLLLDGPVGGGQDPLLFGGEDAVLQLSQ